MAKFTNSPPLLFFLVFNLLIMLSLSLNAKDDRVVYIVYMGSITEENSLSSEDYMGLLHQVVEDRSMCKENLLTSYGRSFNGFAANLTEKESENLKSMKGVVSVFPSRTLKLQTTRSWDFMGFTETIVQRNKTAESNIIIGVIDSGIYPESPSFKDDGFSPPPVKWKGVCMGGPNFTCNNKLIGARTVFQSARDDTGHGTHTASTAAGMTVDNASFFGLAEGSARGAVPSSRIAAYKACNSSGCYESDVLAAFDDAIADGVDLITISLGGMFSLKMYEDAIAIGAFHAMQRGILTVQPAGNMGNESSSVNSVAPWLFTAAASTMDRHIVAKAVLGNGKILTGNSVNSFDLKGNQFPLVYGKEVSSSCSEEEAKMCNTKCIDKNLKGKIVVCNNEYDDDELFQAALQANATGVLSRTYMGDVSFIRPLPAIGFNDPEFDALLSYINSTSNPTATILKSESSNDTSAPVVASFSGRGPSEMAPDILKPDITATGVDILAAYPPEVPVSSDNSEQTDKRSVRYSILSGTSMAAPHVAGASAYVKSLHPDWSPSVIKSALMTTAQPMSPSKNSDAEFAYGSGLINPVKAGDPGLVYETTQDDYTTFLCRLHYTETQIRTILGNMNFTCPKPNKEISSPNDVNYPSMVVGVNANANASYNITFSRTVINVGIANCTYTAKVETGDDMKVTVTPSSLSFTSLNEKKSFQVTVVGILGSGVVPAPQRSASLVWSDGQHSVRSPIVVYAKIKYGRRLRDGDL